MDDRAEAELENAVAKYHECYICSVERLSFTGSECAMIVMDFHCNGHSLMGHVIKFTDLKRKVSSHCVLLWLVRMYSYFSARVLVLVCLPRIY